VERGSSAEAVEAGIALWLTGLRSPRAVEVHIQLVRFLSQFGKNGLLVARPRSWLLNLRIPNVDT
jgi:hypothetical protein